MNFHLRSVDQLKSKEIPKRPLAIKLFFSFFLFLAIRRCVLLTKVQAQMCWSRVESSSFEEAEMESDDGEEVAGNIRQNFTLQKCLFQVQIFPFFSVIRFLIFFNLIKLKHEVKTLSMNYERIKRN